MHKILLIEDDDTLSKLTNDYLIKNNYEVTAAKTISEATEILEHSSFSLILLDINLPDGEGFTLCSYIKNLTTTPIIFISARTSIDDKSFGLDIGADDYLTKPYSLKELQSRINAHIRRTSNVSSELIIGDIKVDQEKHIVYKNDNVLSMGNKEYELLLFLMTHQNTVLTKSKILQEVWGYDFEGEYSTLSVHIRWLREKVEDNPSEPMYIKTVFKVGYMMENNDES